ATIPRACSMIRLLWARFSSCSRPRPRAARASARILAWRIRKLIAFTMRDNIPRFRPHRCDASHGRPLPAVKLQARVAAVGPRGSDRSATVDLTVLEPAEPLQQVKRRAVDLDRINRRATLEPLAPTSVISGAPLPKGGSFLNHRPSRSALVW